MSELVVEQLAAEMRQLRERVEDLEDRQELETAIRENHGNPLISWAIVESELSE